MRRHCLRPAFLALSAVLTAITLFVSPGAAQVPGESSSPPLAVDSTASALVDTSGGAMADSLAPPPPPMLPDSAAPAAAPVRIGTIDVAGNARTESERVMRTFEVAPGTRYTKDALRRGLRKLFGLGLFRDVWIEEFPRGESVDLLIHVVERPRVGSIVFNGNKKRETSELEKKLSVRTGDILTPAMFQTQVDSLLKYYRDEGFSRAHVTAAADTNAATNEAALRFQVDEGEKVRVKRIRFEGASAFSYKRLRKAMKTKTKGLFGGGDIKDESFTDDRDKLESFYHDQGYRDARVLATDLTPGARPRDLTLVVRLEEGRRYRTGTVGWTGATVVDSASLRRLPQAKPGEIYNASRIGRGRDEAFALYAEHGYLYVNIEPREAVRDSLVDITYTVTEGKPSHVRLVNILGNRGTREKVIRREINIHEGDLFKRSTIVRSRDDLMRLGIFEDVQPDVSPAESTDVDVVLRVKEKQVGTASAGAGYTGDTGVTGFLELAHNNVLGNAQSLSLHLERGGKREDYFLSFTEPWFRDTPTLLGFSVFNTRTERDLYEEKRVGGSVRLGRPLPWPDYSRGSIAYRLEDVTISGQNFTLQDSIAFSGQPLGVAVRTSSVETVFNRNTNDHPQYPTKGTRLDLNDEFAGGPFGGKVNFHKHRYEGRVYFKSPIKGVTTMLRGRLGILGGYADQSSAPPVYERFRLGGGSTADPLRGYDDYQVVPGKFVQNVYRTEIAGIDSVTTPGVKDTTFRSVFTGRLRYPGGRFMTLYTGEQQFPIVHPLHGVLFFDAGNTWDLWREIKPFDLKMGAGLGLRMEIPLLGKIGLDYGYGFNRDDGPRPKVNFLFGNVSF